MSSENLHEPAESLDPETINLHRAIISLIEELEAVDWYQQRATACPDAELKAVLFHHRKEEIEHAMMNLEWIRRHDPLFDENIRTYIFAKGPITGVEQAEKAAGAGAAGTPSSGGAASLGIGSLRRA